MDKRKKIAAQTGSQKKENDEEGEEADINEFDEQMDVDQKVVDDDSDREVDEQMDETEFKQFDTGELDLPSESDDEQEENEEAPVEDDGDLDEYYRELGVDPAEMRADGAEVEAGEPD